MMWPIGSPELATPVREGAAAVVGCVCLNATEVQWLHDEVPEEFEQDLRLDVLHERALQECLQLAADYETNDCQEMHDEGGWLLSALLATGKEAWLTIGKDIPCSEQATAEQGCTITDDRPSPLALLALALLAAVRRRPRD